MSLWLNREKLLLSLIVCKHHVVRWWYEVATKAESLVHMCSLDYFFITWVMLGDFLLSASMQCFLRSGVVAMWMTVPWVTAHYLYLTVLILQSLTVNVHCGRKHRICCVQWLARKNMRIEIFFILTWVFRSSWLARYYCHWSIFPHGKIGFSPHSSKSVFGRCKGLWHCICVGGCYRRRQCCCGIPMRCKVLVVIPVTFIWRYV